MSSMETVAVVLAVYLTLFVTRRATL